MRSIRTIAKLAAIILALAVFFTACGAKPVQSASGGVSAAEDGVFKVGMECAYPPFNWTQLDNSNGAVPLGDGTYAGGYDVEIAKLVAQSLGMELQIIKIDWDGLTPSLTSGKIDAIIAGMSATTERKQTIDFSDSYYTSDLVVVVQVDGPFAGATTLEDFAGAKIAAQLNTLHADVIAQIPDAEPNLMEDFPTMVMALTSGKIDGYVSERPGALSAVAANPSLTFISFPEGEGFDYDGSEVSIAIGLVKGSLLVADINTALAAISEEQRTQLMDDAVQNQPLNA